MINYIRYVKSWFLFCFKYRTVRHSKLEVFLDTYLASSVHLTHHTWLEEIQWKFVNLFSLTHLMHFRHFSICIIHFKTFETLAMSLHNHINKVVILCVCMWISIHRTEHTPEESHALVVIDAFLVMCYTYF